MIPSNHNLAPHATRRGFTLTELLTVIGIIVIILGVTLPSMNYLMKGNAQKQSINVVTAYIASARATAINSRQPVAIVFFEEAIGTDRWDNNQTAVQLLRGNASAGHMVLSPIPGRDKPEYLPRGIRVATLASTGSVQEVGNDDATKPCRVILFDGSGQMMLINNLIASETNQGWAQSLNSGSAADRSSTPGIVLYDGREYDSAVNDAGKDGATWLANNADLLIINAYTGNVIR